MFNFRPFAIFSLAVLAACSTGVRKDNWQNVRIIARVIAFEASGIEKRDFNQQIRMEAATILKIESPIEYNGGVIKYFHSANVPVGSCLRRVGAKIAYLRPSQAVAGDMGLEYGEVDVKEILEP